MVDTPGAELPLYALGGVSLLSRLDDEMVAALGEAGERVGLTAGEWLFREGADGDVLYVVLSGRLDVVTGEGPRAIVVRSLAFGDAVGELAVLCAAPRSASVRAVRDSVLLRVSQEAIARLCHANPGFALALLHSVGEKLRTRDTPLASKGSRARVLAVVALDVAAPVGELGAALVRAIEPLGRVAFLGPGSVAGDEVAWCGALDGCEREHDFVVLVGSQPDATGAADAWSRFCGRQADRVLAVAGGAPPIVGQDHESWDLVVCGRAADRWASRGWLDVIRPRAHHQVRDPHAPLDVERLARRVTGRSVGVVFSGGGARGLAHLGVISELIEAGVRIDRVGGTSVGALLGALFATGLEPGDLIHTCHTELVDRRSFRDFTWPRTAPIRAHRAEAMLGRLFGSAHLDDLVTDCFCVSADLAAAEVVVHRRGVITEAVGASMSLPGLAPPVRSGGRLLVDGGVLNNVPVDVMAEAEEGPVIAVDVMMRGSGGFSGRMPSIIETLARASVIGSRNQLEARLAAADLVIAPDVGDVGLLEFARFDEIVAAGRRAARGAVEAGEFPISSG